MYKEIINHLTQICSVLVFIYRLTYYKDPRPIYMVTAIARPFLKVRLFVFFVVGGGGALFALS